MLKNRFTLTALSFGLSLQLLSVVSVAEPACSPGPKCEAIANRATQIVQTLQSQLGGGMRDALGVSYCLNMVNAEVFRACAVEFNASGNSSCAHTMDQMKQEKLNTAEQSAGSAQSLTSGQWKNKCGW